MYMFLVPKESIDIRIVYNGTSSGINNSLWGPHFALPTLCNNQRSIEEVNIMVYSHVCVWGGVFNFVLGEEFRL